MEKEEILVANYKNLKENLVELNRNLVFIDDFYAQKLEEIEDELEKKIFCLEESKYYLSNQSDFDELETKINKCLKDFNFNSAFDVYKTFINLLETFESDLSLINSYPLKQSFSKKIVDDVFLFNLSSLGTIKKQLKLMLDNIDEITDKAKNLNKK